MSSLPAGVAAWAKAQLAGADAGWRDVDAGYSGGMTGIVSTESRTAFLKAVPVDSPASADYVTEAVVLASLPPTVGAAELFGHATIDGWRVLLTEFVRGRQPREPWEPDTLNTVLRALDQATYELTPSPVLGLPSIAERMHGRAITWRALRDVAHGFALHRDDLSDWERRNLGRLADAEGIWQRIVAGDALLHFDLRHDNILIDEADRPRFLDWGRACTGPAWVDVVCLLLESEVPSGTWEDLFLATDRGRAADPDAVDQRGQRVGVTARWPIRRRPARPAR